MEETCNTFLKLQERDRNSAEPRKTENNNQHQNVSHVNHHFG
jgi:hypothetical protein